MTQISDQLLIECLDLLDEGMSVDEILALYPDQAELLRPYLQTALSLESVAKNPTLGQKQKSQQAMLAEAANLNREPMTRPSFFNGLRRLLVPIAMLTVILFLFGSGLQAASAAALPGDALYSSKRMVERIRLQLATSPEKRLVLIAEQDAERVREVQSLLQTDRDVDVVFTGAIEEIAAEVLIIANVTVHFVDESEIAGSPQLGALTKVNGRVQGGQLQATRVEILTPPADELPEMIPTAFPTETPVPPTPTVTSTLPPTATVTETAVPTATNTPEPTLLPTATVEAEPTATDDNDDSDDDSDDDEQIGNDNNDNEADDEIDEEEEEESDADNDDEEEEDETDTESEEDAEEEEDDDDSEGDS